MGSLCVLSCFIISDLGYIILLNLLSKKPFSWEFISWHYYRDHPEEPMPRLLEYNYISPLKLVTRAASVLNHCIWGGSSGLRARLENHFVEWWDPCYAFRAIYSFKWTGISRHNALLGRKRQISASVRNRCWMRRLGVLEMLVCVIYLICLKVNINSKMTLIIIKKVTLKFVGPL